MAKQLIALAFIAAGTLAFGSPEIAQGANFEASDEAAKKLIAEGLAKEDEATVTAVKSTAVRVLAACEHGQPNDVVNLPSALLKQAKADGLVDDDKAAVAYARSLKAAK